MATNTAFTNVLTNKKNIIMIKMEDTEIDVKEINPRNLKDGDVIYCAWAEDDEVTSWLAAVKHVDEEYPEYIELYASLMLTDEDKADGRIEYKTDQDVSLDLLRYATEEEVDYFMRRLEVDNEDRDDAITKVFDAQVKRWLENK